MSTSAMSGLSQAWKISSEFVAAIFVGGHSAGWQIVGSGPSLGG